MDHEVHTVQDHRDLIREQFTRQAEAFSSAPQIRDEEALRLLLALASAGPADSVLDVACGPGIVACAFAAVAAHAIGIDITPAMVERARGLREEKGLSNVSCLIGDVYHLPFADGAFSIVLSRYSFHHLERPGAVLREMARACAPGGRVLVADVVASEDATTADAFNEMERLRDPSHVRALSRKEAEGLFKEAGLSIVERSAYRLEFEVEKLVAGSSPLPGAAECLRAIFRGSLARDSLGLRTRDAGGELVCSYPIAVWVGVRP